MILVAGCATVAPKDPVSLQNAIGLKAESLALLGKAIDPPDAHAPEIQGLRQKLQAAVAYEKSKGDVNSISVEQWDLLSNPNENLLGGFLRKWEADGKGQSPAFIDGVKKLVTKAFDQIIKVENEKP